MSITLGQAASTFEHYILVALESSGEKISSDMRMELMQAVEAFRNYDTSLQAAATQRQRVGDKSGSTATRAPD